MGSGAVAVMNWVPVVGGVVGGIWALVCTVVGLQRMHGTTMGRVIAALLVPGGVGVLFGIIAALGLAAGTQ